MPDPHEAPLVPASCSPSSTRVVVLPQLTPAPFLRALLRPTDPKRGSSCAESLQLCSMVSEWGAVAPSSAAALGTDPGGPRPPPNPLQCGGVDGEPRPPRGLAGASSKVRVTGPRLAL